MARKTIIGKPKAKLSITEQAYLKEYNRIKRASKRVEKEGYVGVSLPKVPKRITQASIRKLEKIKPKTLREKSKAFVFEQTGEVVKPKAAIKYQKEERAARRKLKREQKEEEYIPTISIVDSINDKLSHLDLPKDYTLEPPVNSMLTVIRDKDVHPYLRYIRLDRLNRLQGILLNTIQRNTDNENKSYVEYLMNNQDTIFNELDIIRYHSSGTRVEAAYNILGNILNHKPLSKEDQDMLLELSEQTNGWNDLE